MPWPIRFAERASRSERTWPKASPSSIRKQYSTAEFKRFVLMSIGSSDEMRVWIRYCVDLGYVDEETWRQWRDEYHEISKMLQGLHRNWR